MRSCAARPGRRSSVLPRAPRRDWRRSRPPAAGSPRRARGSNSSRGSRAQSAFVRTPVVKPLSRSSRASCAPISTRFSGDSTIASSRSGADSGFHRRMCSASGGMTTSRKRCVWLSTRRGKCGFAQVQHSGLGRRVDLARRPYLSDLSVFDQDRSPGSTCPDRGSRRWAALRSVMPCPSWAAAGRPLSNTAHKARTSHLNIDVLSITNWSLEITVVAL